MVICNQQINLCVMFSKMCMLIISIYYRDSISESLYKRASNTSMVKRKTACRICLHFTYIVSPILRSFYDINLRAIPIPNMLLALMLAALLFAALAALLSAISSIIISLFVKEIIEMFVTAMVYYDKRTHANQFVSLQ